MAKPKFTLTHDLVKIESEPEILLEKTIHHSPMDEREDLGKEQEKEAMNLKVEKQLKKEFHLWCIMQGKTMTEVIEEAIKELIKR
jgi:hypothetical protein